MTGLDLKELGKRNPAVALATAVVVAVNRAAALLRGFRSKSGLSQADMAGKLGITQPRIAQLESGKPGNAPSIEQLAEYAFHTGNELLICDRAQVRELPEYQALLEKTNSLEARIGKLEGKIHSRRRNRRGAPASVPR
jgi:transcriptional regulator with XRE-family HTH domain